ncbi:DUF6261 family protein [Aerococcaceae bacterium NML190073]|nr:DUF6261 family protein [Aerococcaceae bacterium NML190073]
MSKTLSILQGAYLHKEEKNQIVARLITEIETSKVKITDEDVKRLLARLKSKLTALQSAKQPPRKSEHTDKLKEADKIRDADVKALFTSIRAYRASSRPQEKQAYHALYHLCKMYRGMTLRNYEEETAMIGGLLTQLKSEEYRDDVSALSLTQLVNNLTESQTQFETLFTARVKEEIRTAPVNIQELRLELFEEYQRFCEFIDALAWGKGADQYHKLLVIINNGRKYYSDSIAKRIGHTKKRRSAAKKECTTEPKITTDTIPSESTAPTTNEATLEERGVDSTEGASDSPETM